MDSPDAEWDGESMNELKTKRVTTEKRDMVLLKAYSDADPQTQKRIRMFLDSKSKKFTDATAVKYYRFGISFLDATRKKADWPVSPLNPP